MRRPGFVLVFVATAAWLAVALPAAADPQADSCEGKNPAYCKSDKPAPPPPPAAAKDCEGKNPLYCQPTQSAPAAPSADGEKVGEEKKQRAATQPDGQDADDNPDSNNPAHNPNQNPNQNPNRRPPRSNTGNSGK